MTSDYEPFEEWAVQGDAADQIIVGFNEKLGDGGIERARTRVDSALKNLVGMGATEVKRFVEPTPDDKAVFALAVIRLDGPELTLAALQERLESKDEKLTHIAFFERNGPIVMAGFNDDWFVAGQQWALATLGVTEPWTVVPPGAPAKTIVAIVDSGLRRPDGTLHKDLGLVEAGGGVDADGHGTFLAGTIAAAPDNNEGIASPIPTTWNISLLSLKFFSPLIDPSAVNAAIAIAFAVIKGAKVINASWHLAPGDGGLQILRLFMALATPFSLVVFAAGNDGTDNEVYPIYPANFGAEPFFKGKVLTALATGRDDCKAFFSNYGRNIVDIGAPGLRILTTERYLVDEESYPLEWAPYAEYSGTSPAAAYVSSGAALVFALNPGWQPADVAQHLKASAETIECLKIACIDGKRLNLARAVYGPLHITAPLPGAVLPVNALTNITWTTDYNNPKFVQVAITFTEQVSGNVYSLGTPSIGAGSSPWTPKSPPLSPVPVTGWITITPTTGNFPVRSGLITVA
jgi:subtilisin family serine protease